MGVPVNLIFDPQYKGYVADVPEMPGCMSQGKTIESALENVKEAIGLFQETVESSSSCSKIPTLTTLVEV